MEMKWTREQQKVIELRRRNILVSAAAGSGKTAVLVERIITMITNINSPLDIDRLLIVTFTKAAASEMKARIGEAIKGRLDKDPDNAHLQRQMTLLGSAKIMTLHSFCTSVIKDYFNMIDIDPSFRVAEENELVLLQADTLESLLEEHYGSGDEGFLNFIECYSKGKRDYGIEELILQVYKYSRSYPWPDEWLDACIKWFDVGTAEALEETPLILFLKDYLRQMVSEMKNDISGAIDICNEADGPTFYQEALADDLLFIGQLEGAKSLTDYRRCLSDLSFPALSRKRMPDASEDKKNQVKQLREAVKSIIKDIQKNFFFQDMEQMVKDIQAVREPMENLVMLVKEFDVSFSKAKQEKNIIDFNDLEHFALDILTLKKDGEIVPSLAAVELSERFEEILCDEYQDSNLVQETLLTMISKERYGQPNIFMVGDVKQSIYKFRLAKPELFMEKYDIYTLDDSLYQRIDLHKNFRSRSCVLDAVNSIFYQIMGRNLGGIHYDEEVALYAGADFPTSDENISIKSDIMLIDVSKELLEEEGDKSYTERELEAKAVALRIKELVHETRGLKVLDKSGTGYRNCTYKDIVILLRTMSGWSDTFVKVLADEGVPAYADTKTGFFETTEVKTILALMSIVDNPKQDIPFTAVLISPIGGFTNEEVTIIRTMHPGRTMDESCRAFLKPEADLLLEEYFDLDRCDVIRKRLESFLEMLNRFRSMIPFMPIHELLRLIYDETGYYHIASAMVLGDQRQANLDMLTEKAIAYEKTSYRGLFNFIRYIEQLKKYEVDFGEAIILGEHEDTVRMMSIHKSKGLEYPVVFVSGMGKSFNHQDAKASLILHSDYGFGPDAVDLKLRTKCPTLIKKVMSKKTILENMGEELRVLYVALTRAKEKLIMTGTIKEVDKAALKWHYQKVGNNGKMPLNVLVSASHYLDLIMPVAGKLEDTFDIQRIDIGDLMQKEISVHALRGLKQQTLLDWDETKVFDANISQMIKGRLSWKYRYDNETRLYTKMTVSELKKMGQNQDEEWSENILKPRSIGNAALRGTVVHKVLEQMDLNKIRAKQDVEKFVESLMECQQITSEEAGLVDCWKIYDFTRTKLAKRMAEADRREQLFKEKQFVIGIAANQLNEELLSDETILVQGIIDVYFIEGNHIILADYKTDYVEAGREEILIHRYENQLKYYAKALEQLTGMSVSEKYIYSFALGREIAL